MGNKGFWFLLIFSVTTLYAAGTEERFESANKLYQQKQYEKALKLYIELIDEEYEGASLFYNTGNTYFRLGKTGYAILYYEKALRLAPGDDDIQHNLNFAYARTTDKLTEFPSFFLFRIWEDLLSMLSVSGWIYLAFALYIMLIASAAGYFLFRDPAKQKYSFFAGAGILMVFLLSLAVTAVKLNSEVNIKKGIVLQQASSVKLSPDEGSNDAFVIHEGLKVRLEDRVGDWYKIRLDDGKTGWIPGDDIGII